MPLRRSRPASDERAGEPSTGPVTVSGELRAPVSPGIELCYQTYGRPEDDPLLLVMGLGGPMTWWDTELCTLLAQSGFYVIRYDNRDTGRSSRGVGRVTRPMIVRAATIGGVRAPYSLGDLAGDAFGLLDHLGIAEANVCGVSMGGMIAQTMAIAEPQRVRSLVSIMSTTGQRTVGWQHPSLFSNLLAPRPADRETYIETSMRTARLIGSPGYPEDPADARARAETTFDRGLNGAGVLRHMMAVLAQPNRTRALASLRMPAAVIHGMQDKLVHVSGGRATAQAVPGAQLLLVPGMGHDMPKALFETFRDVIRSTADRATPN